MPASNKPVFTHHRLEVYHLALRMAALAKAVADSEPLHPARAAKRAEDRRTPRGYRSCADHLKRSSGNTVLLIGQGANRYSSGIVHSLLGQRYEEALGGEPLHPARAAKRAEDRRTAKSPWLPRWSLHLGWLPRRTPRC